MKIYTLLLFSFLTFSSFLPGFVFSQNMKITGIITDKKTKETIVGATVLIEGTMTGTTTDLNGNFTIPGLVAGTYKIKVSYISYKSISLENIKVSAELQPELKIEIEPEVISIKGVTIKGSKKTDTEGSMLMAMKLSNLQVTGVSGQQILKSQDRDASEVIKRVPGVTITDNRFIIVRGLNERYNTVWLNGITTPSSESDVKAFSFDVIPSSLIENILVYKTPAPELPGDFAGASVQIYTRNIPDANSFSVSYSGSFRSKTTFGDFITYQGGKTDWLGFDDGTRSLPSSFPSATDFISLANSNVASDKETVQEWGRTLNKNWTTTEGSASPDQRFSVTLARKITAGKLTIGHVSTLNYSYTNQFKDIFRASYQDYDSINDKSDTSYFFFDKQYTGTAKVGAMHNWSFRFGKNKIEFRNLFNQMGWSRTTLREGKDFYGGITIKSQELRFMSRCVYSGQIGGQHVLTGERTNLNWTLGYSYANRKEPDLKRLTMLKSQDDPDDPHYGEYSVQFSTAATPEMTGRVFLDMFEKIYTGTANIEHKIKIGNFSPEIKAGIYFDRKNREFNARNLGYRIAKSSAFNWEIPYMSIDSIFADTNINNTNGIKLDEKTNASDSYIAENELLAAYLSFKIPVTALLNIYTGVRIEKNREALNSFRVDNPTIPVNVENDTVNLFPSANATYNLTEKSLLRLAYGMTINRPEFREIAPILFYDFDLKAGIRGNPELQNCYIHNYDFRYELYPATGESVTMGVFYKNFIHPIESKVIPSGSGLDYSFGNADKAQSYGLEIDIRKSMTALGRQKNMLRHMKDLTFVFNFSLIKSRVSFEEQSLELDRALQGQSPYIINTGLYYQKDSIGLSVSLLYNIIGRRIIFVGDPYTGDPDIYEMPRHQLDLTVTKKIGKHLTLKGGVQDLLNNEMILKQTVSYLKDTDGNGTGDQTSSHEQISYRTTPGSYFSLGATWNF